MLIDIVISGLRREAAAAERAVRQVIHDAGYRVEDEPESAFPFIWDTDAHAAFNTESASLARSTLNALAREIEKQKREKVAEFDARLAEVHEAAARLDRVQQALKEAEAARQEPAAA